MKTFLQHIPICVFAALVLFLIATPSRAFADIPAERDSYARGVELVTYTPPEDFTGIIYCDGNEMYWVPGGNYWALLYPLTGDKVEGHFFTSDPNGQRLELSTLRANGSGMMAADLNGNGVVNIVDAQIAYDLSKGKRDYNPEDMELWLAADVNADKFLDASDAFAIQRACLAGQTGSVTYAALFESGKNLTNSTTIITRKEYSAGTPSSTIPDAQRMGYTFMGWFDADENPLGEYLPTDRRVTVYHAKWDKDANLPKLLCVGDSFGEGFTAEGMVKPWCNYIAEALDMELYNYSVGGMGVVSSIDGGTFNTQITRAHNNGLKPDRIFITTGYNDYWASYNQMFNNMNVILNNIAAWWPEAEVYVFGLTWGSRWYGAQYETLSYALQNACNNHGVFYQSGAWTWLFDRDDLVSSDLIHPNQQGQEIIAQRMIMTLNGQDPTIYTSTLTYDYGDWGQMTITRNYLTVTAKGWNLTFGPGSCIVNLPPAYKCDYVVGPGAKGWFNHNEGIVTVSFDRAIIIRSTPGSLQCDWKSGSFFFNSTLNARHPVNTKTYSALQAETWDRPTSRG